MEPKLNNLWNVYQRAKADYQAVAQLKSHVTTKAARFLRDTAENLLSYLENKTVDSAMMAELDATYKMAKSTAVSLSAGKKRKFDCPDRSRVRGAPRGPSGFPKAPRAGRPQSYGNRRSRSPEIGGRGGTVGYEVEIFGAPSNPFTQSSRTGGAPFGYSRPVDSYQPYNQY